MLSDERLLTQHDIESQLEQLLELWEVDLLE